MWQRFCFYFNKSLVSSYDINLFFYDKHFGRQLYYRGFEKQLNDVDHWLPIFCHFGKLGSVEANCE